jgi:hypothetical protein
VSNANPNRLGQDNLSGDALALFYKLFSGEVLAAHDASTKFLTHQRVRNISSGKSAGFNYTGKTTAGYHTPGTEILGQNVANAEQIITVDSLLISSIFVANIDEAMAHYDQRSELSKQMGLALGRTFDKQSARVGLQAARATNPVSGLPGGTVITLPVGYDAATDLEKAQMLADALFKAHETLRLKDVDPMGAKAFITNPDYFRLVRNKELLNVDWGGLGSYARAELPMVGGLPLEVTNHMPQQNDTALIAGGVFLDGGDTVAAKYAGDFSKTVALVSTPEAIGTVNLIDIAIESQYDVRRQGTLMVAKRLHGSGWLRPETAIEIRRA